MKRKPRRNHTPMFKARAALAAARGDKTLDEQAVDLQVLHNQTGQSRLMRKCGNG
jgi:transposase